MKSVVLTILIGASIVSQAQDWAAYEVPVDLGEEKKWVLQEDVSDDFNYTSEASNKSAAFLEKWDDFYHNGWKGPAPTLWQRDHSLVEGGKLLMKASRVSGETLTFSSGGKSYTLPATRLGCITSRVRVKYPAYVEAFVKITNSVLASDVWMLSPDDTQEIDICEAYGSARYSNDWFSNKRLHLSHHVFIRQPFTDWQPNDEGSFYTDGSTVWSEDYHRIGVYWRDPWHLEYYVDGKLVRTRSGKDQIDPKYHTNATNQGDTSNDTRTGMSKEMDIIINTEDQTWRAIQGLSPTDRELSLVDDHTFKVDWIRVYKPQDIESALEEVESDVLNISPNPSRDRVSISSQLRMKEVKLQSVSGTLIKQVTCNASTCSVGISDVSAGVYIIQVILGNGSCVNQQIIKL